MTSSHSSSHTNSHSNTYSSSHGNSHTNSYSNSHSNTHSNSHSNHGNHANSVTTSGSLSPSHTVTAGTTSVTSLDNHMSVYNSSGILSSLLAAATEARNTLNSPNSTSAPGLSSAATPTGLSNLLSYSGGSHTIYNYSPGINVDISYNQNGTSGHASTGGTISNSPNSKIASKNIHCNTTGGVNLHCNTSTNTWQNPIYDKTFPVSSVSVSSGSPITQNTLVNVLNTINKGKIVSTFTAPSYSASGNTKYTYSNAYSNSHKNSHSNTYSNSHSSSHTNSHGNSYASSHSNSKTSSVKYKFDIKPFVENAVSLINDINVVEFKYKKWFEDSSITHYGFIAEDTSEIFSTRYHDRMDFTNCIGILLKAVQELDKEIKDLKNSK